MDSPSPPQAPDPHETAAAQGKYNADAARITATLNRPDQITPFGTLRWTQGPGQRTFDQAAYDAALQSYQTGAGAQSSQFYQGSMQDTPTSDFGVGGMMEGMPAFGAYAGRASGNSVNLPDRNDPRFWSDTPSDKWTSEVILDPKVQAIIDAQMDTSLGLSGAIQNALGRVNQTMEQPLDFSADSLSGDRRRVEDAVYGQHTRWLDPQFAEREDQLRSTLMNRGFMEGTEAFDRELQRMSMSRNDAYDQARTSAILAGGGEQDRQIANLLRGRNQVINELASLRSGQQTQMPQFSPGQSGAVVNPANYAGAVGQQYQGQLAAYNADVASNNSLMGGLFSLGASALTGGLGTGLLGGLGMGGSFPMMSGNPMGYLA